MLGRIGLLLSVLLFCLHNPVWAAVSRCEYLLTGKPEALHDASVLLSWALDFTRVARTPSVASGLSIKALRAFHLDKIAPARYPLLRITSRFHVEHGAKISLLVNAGEKNVKLMTFERRNEFYVWRRPGAEWARLPKGAQVGFYPEEFPEYSIYVSVVPLSSRSYQINIGLDVDCENVDDYINTRRFVERIQKSGGMKCRFPVLRFKGFAEP